MKKLVVLALIALTIVSCGKQDKKQQLDELIKQRDKLTEQINTLKKELNMKLDSVKTINVSVQAIEKTSFAHFIDVQGKIDGDQNVIVSTPMGGIITQILVTEGQHVNKGDLLVTFDASILNQSMEEVKTQLEFATTMYNKQKALYDQKIGSEVQYLSAKTNKESMERRLATLREQAAQMTIKAPISGSVEEIPIKVGQMLTTGFPAMKIVNLSKIKVMADVAEAFSPKIAKGNDVILNFPDMNKEIKTKLTFASKLINPVNRTFQVEVKLDNDGSFEYRANMVTIVKIIDYKNDSALVVPVNLIQHNQDGDFIFVAVDENGKKKAIQRTIVTGISYNGLIEVKEGLMVGDQIITAGYQDLMNEQEISF